MNMYLYHKFFIQCIHQLRFVFSHLVKTGELNPRSPSNDPC